jgi:hypothetical protein
MNEYSSKRLKKEAEEETLKLFSEAYESVTGEPIEVIEVSERPDFICVRRDGCKVGVELAKVRRGHPDDILWDRLIDKQDYMSIEDALEKLQEVAAEKETKRNEPDWRFPESTMLLIELTDIPLSQIKGCIKVDILPDLYATGFTEIWLADFTGLEAYGNVELFCVRPDEWAGYYPRGPQKPYG